MTELEKLTMMAENIAETMDSWDLLEKEEPENVRKFIQQWANAQGSVGCRLYNFYKHAHVTIPEEVTK